MVLTGTQAELSCTVAVLNSYGSANITNGYTYKTSLTPVITDVSPHRGGTAGGTVLTVTGYGFRSKIMLSSIYPFINPSIIYITSLLRFMGKLEPVQLTLCKRQGTNRPGRQSVMQLHVFKFIVRDSK